jgi:hypothetical protein
MDQQLAVLIAGDFAGRLDGLGLRIVEGSAALVTGSADSPPGIGGDDVLVFIHNRIDD